jgi:uncharacterized protein RhaS with RHS repeats
MKPGGTVEHYSLDHLGTPRLITDGGGGKIGYHVYWPFGEAWSPGNAGRHAARVHGHERDADATGGNAPLNYMHVWYYGAGFGRFVSVDPIRPAPRRTRRRSWRTPSTSSKRSQGFEAA